MREWFLAGGWVMWFLVVLGGVALHASWGFARRAAPEDLPRIQALRSAVGWTTLTGVASCFAAVGSKIPANPAWAHSPDLHLLILTGISESLVPAILGGALLSISSLLLAAGHGRMRSQGATP
jgi:hypothetical protein